MSLYHHLVGVSRSAGFELAMVTPSEIEAMHPFYDARSNELGGVVGGFYDSYENDIDPSQLTQALAGRARSNGVSIERFTTVTSITRTDAGE
jgi:dimethylglycine dehydrogenase